MIMERNVFTNYKNLFIRLFSNHQDTSEQEIQIKLLKRLCKVKPIQNVSGFSQITMFMTSTSHGGLPQLKIEIISNDVYNKRANFNGSELISGFLSVGHLESSQKDYRIPLYHFKQIVYLPEELLYKKELVKRMEEGEVTARHSFISRTIDIFTFVCLIFISMKPKKSRQFASR